MNPSSIKELRDEFAAPVIADLEALADKVEKTGTSVPIIRTVLMLRSIAKTLFDLNLNVGQLRRSLGIIDNNQPKKFEAITGKRPVAAIRDARFEIAFSLLKTTEKRHNNLIFESLGFWNKQSAVVSLKLLTMGVTPVRTGNALNERQIQVPELFTLRDAIRHQIRLQNLGLEPHVSLDSPRIQEARQIATKISLPDYTRPEDIEGYIATVVQEILVGRNTDDIFQPGHKQQANEQLWQFLQAANLESAGGTVSPAAEHSD